MKNPIKIVVIVLVIALIIGVAFAVIKNRGNGLDPNEHPSGEPISGEKTNYIADKTTVETRFYENSMNHEYIHWDYPEISSFHNKSMEKSINDLIKKDMNGYLDEVDIRLKNRDSIDPAEYYRYIVSYEKFTYDKYLFLVVSHDYNTGGIRSVKYKNIYSIDVVAEELVNLSKMFDPGVKYEQAIISEIQKQADRRSIELMGGNGIDSLKENTKFYIKEGKLIIYFDPSEIAANVYGEVTFEMPFTLKSNGTYDINVRS